MPGPEKRTTSLQVRDVAAETRNFLHSWRPPGKRRLNRIFKLVAGRGRPRSPQSRIQIVNTPMIHKLAFAIEDCSFRCEFGPRTLYQNMVRVTQCRHLVSKI